MENVYLQEAFRALDILNEEDFNLSSTEDIKDLSDAIEDDENELNSLLDVIDPETDEVEEIKDNYTGNVILDCKVCHSKLYKDPSEVVIDEEKGVANIDEECPCCYSTEGYEIIGQVAPYQETTHEIEDEDNEESDDIEVKVDDEEVEVEDEDAKDIEEELENKCPECNKNPCECKKEEKLTESADISEYQKWVDYDMEKYGKISHLTMHKIKKAGFSVVKDQYGDYEVIADRKDESLNEKYSDRKDLQYEIDRYNKLASRYDKLSIIDELMDAGYSYKEAEYVASHTTNLNEDREYDESLKEHFEKVEIETDKEKMEMTSDENGRTVVVTEPKDNNEMLAPVSDETVDEIDMNSAEASEDEFPEEDVDIDEFSEEEFDELGESYLKKVYENVDSFKTSSVRLANNQLIVEGIIGFNSGKKKQTTFVFEGKEKTKKGSMKFIGENLQLSRGKKSFTLNGKMDGKKFISESFNYNYRAKDAKGNSTRLYGTVRVK